MQAFRELRGAVWTKERDYSCRDQEVGGKGPAVVPLQRQGSQSLDVWTGLVLFELFYFFYRFLLIPSHPRQRLRVRILATIDAAVEDGAGQRLEAMWMKDLSIEYEND